MTKLLSNKKFTVKKYSAKSSRVNFKVKSKNRRGKYVKYEEVDSEKSIIKQIGVVFVLTIILAIGLFLIYSQIVITFSSNRDTPFVIGSLIFGAFVSFVALIIKIFE